MTSIEVYHGFVFSPEHYAVDRWREYRNSQDRREDSSEASEGEPTLESRRRSSWAKIVKHFKVMEVLESWGSNQEPELTIFVAVGLTTQEAPPGTARHELDIKAVRYRDAEKMMVLLGPDKTSPLPLPTSDEVRCWLYYVAYAEALYVSVVLDTQGDSKVLVNLGFVRARGFEHGIK